MTVEEIKINGDKGQPISAYTARPSGPGPFPGVVLVHHLPGWSEWYIEQTRKFAHNGYIAICANLYERAAARAIPTMSLPRCAPRAAYPMPRWSGTPRAP
jgi:carboxymethylenebutenolidase